MIAPEQLNNNFKGILRMDWKSLVHMLRALIARWIVPRMLLDAASPASVEQLGMNTESQRVGNIMTTFEGAPGAPPALPEADQFEAFFTNLDKHAARTFVVFTREEAKRLYDILNLPVQKKVDGSGVSE